MEIVSGIFFGFAVAVGIVLLQPSTIESNTRISPELKITIKDNKVDTVFVYTKE